MCHFFFLIARSVYINSVLTVLAFHCRGMLEMVSLQKNSNSQIFLCNRQNPVKWSACVATEKIAIECGIVFLETRPFLGRKPLKACLYLMAFQWQRHIPQLKLKKRSLRSNLLSDLIPKFQRDLEKKVHETQVSKTMFGHVHCTRRHNSFLISFNLETRWRTK